MATRIQKQKIVEHGELLIKIFDLTVDTDPYRLCSRLHTLEMQAHEAATRYCNGDMGSPQYERQSGMLMDKVNAILHFRESRIPVFHNGDPRGYALKIDDEWMRTCSYPIHRDWGGYGILAPEIE